MSMVRYRYRVYPTPGQEQMLARTFGCVRVVYNDCLGLRQDAHAAGEKVSDTDVQRRVVTLAKQTPEREWLGEVASVALVQACQDARCAYRNWSDSLSGKPRHLLKAQRRLGRAQRALARKQRGSANREKAVHRVAVLHRKVREARLDAHHKLALRLVRENQAVHLEDLSIAGLARASLARSIHDAGWSTLVRLIEDKAAHQGRAVVKVGRGCPSSQLCSMCGHRGGPKPLNVRAWTCGAEHDRDLNAARNVLAEGRRIAAGLVEIENACGAGVRPGRVPAVGDEAGTRLARLA